MFQNVNVKSQSDIELSDDLSITQILLRRLGGVGSSDFIEPRVDLLLPRLAEESSSNFVESSSLS